MAMVYLGLGTNLGDRKINLEKACEAISEWATIQASSSIYETEAWGYTDQPAFYNQVIAVETSLSPTELLKQVKKIEEKLGRIKSFRWGPRLIDIDILFYDQEKVNLPNLVIPHKHVHKRPFVLVPLAEIAPDFLHPTSSKSILELLNELPDREGVKRCDLP